MRAEFFNSSQSSFLSEVVELSSSLPSGQTLFLSIGVVSDIGTVLFLTGLCLTAGDSISYSSNMSNWYLCSSRYVVNNLAYSGCLSAKCLNSSEKYRKHRYYSAATESKEMSVPAPFTEADLQLPRSKAYQAYHTKYLGLCFNCFPQKQSMRTIR